jgi:hypothetical protein
VSLPPGPNLTPVEVRVAAADPVPPHPAPVRAAVALMGLGAVFAAADAVVRLVAWDRDELQRNLDAAGISPGNLEGFFTIVRVLGFGAGLAGAGLWVVHAVAAHRGRGWVRPWATALAVVFVLMNLANVGDAGPLGLAYLGLRTVIAVAAVVLLRVPASTAFFRAAARPRG